MPQAAPTEMEKLHPPGFFNLDSKSKDMHF